MGSPGSYYNSSNACPAAAVNSIAGYNDLGDTLPHLEQVGQFAVFRGLGYAYEAVGTNGTSLVVPALPAGSTIIAVYLLQVGAYTPNDNCPRQLSDGNGWPASAAATFNGTPLTGAITGVGNFIEQWDQPVFGIDNNSGWGEGGFNARFTVPSALVSPLGGTYTLTQQAGSDQITPVSDLIIVYTNPSVSATGVVVLADGLFMWHPKPDDEPGSGPGLINDGSRALPVTLNWGCTGETLCNPATAMFTRMAEVDSSSGEHSDYADELVAPGYPSTSTAIPTPLWTGAPGVINNWPAIDTYVNPAGGFTAGQTQMTWALGGESGSKTTYIVNALAAAFECPITSTAAATLVKSASETTANLNDTITFNLAYQYNPSGSSAQVTDKFTSDPGVCIPYGWSPAVPTTACFEEAGGVGGLMDGTNDSNGKPQTLLNNGSWGSTGVLDVTINVTQYYTNGIVFDAQGSGTNGYVLEVTDAYAGYSFSLYASPNLTTAIGGPWPAPAGLPTTGFINVQVAIANGGSGCPQQIAIAAAPAGSGAYSAVATVCDSTYTSGFSGFWRSENNDTLRYDAYSWTPSCPSAANVVVTDTLAASLCYLGASGTAPTSVVPASGSGNVLTWDLGTLACGSVGSLTFTAVVCGLPPVGSGCLITNTASMASSSFTTVDSNVVNITALCATPTPTATPTVTASPSATRTPTPTATPSLTSTPTDTVTATPSSTPTRTDTPTGTDTPTDTATPTATPTDTVTATPTPTSTWTPSATFTDSDTVTATRTGNPSFTPTPTVTATSTATPPSTPTDTPTDSPTSTATRTDTPTGTVTDTATATPTDTPTSTWTATPTATPSDTETLTSSPTPTATPTCTVSPNDSPTPTPSVTVTLTATQTDTVTATATDTPTATPTSTHSVTWTMSATVTATPSASVTGTESSTCSATPTDTASATDTATASVTATRSATPTPTPSQTPSPTGTQSNTFTPTPTATLSWTPSLTPVPVPYTMSVAVYNSAGELVKTLFNGPSAFSPTGLAASMLSQAANGTFPVLLSIGNAGASTPIVWQEDNNNGQAVSGGVYYVQVRTTDAFGHVTSLTEAVTVLGAAGQDSLQVFNSAGELVQQINLSGLPAPASGLSVVGASAGIAGQADIRLKVDYTGKSGAADQMETWNGTNSLGQPVQSGVYMVRLVYSTEGESVVVKVVPVTVLNLPGGSAQASLASAIIAPQPFLASLSGDSALTVVYTPVPGLGMEARLYALDGALAAQGEDAQGTGRCPVPVTRLASGVYLVELRMVNGEAALARRMMKAVLVR